MSKTAQEISDLKNSWRNDPCWDIEDTEGFESVKQELYIFRLQTELKWAEERANRAENALRAFATALRPYLNNSL